MGHVGSIALERAILGIQAGFTQQGSWLSYPTTLCDCVQTGQRLAQEESLFFFKKKNQKTFAFWRLRTPGRLRQNTQFFGLFSRKNGLP
jgi:5-deoxy-D-glucuronate isomerase